VFNSLLKYLILLVITLTTYLTYSQETQPMESATPKLITNITEYEVSVHEWHPKDVTEEITILLENENSHITKYGTLEYGNKSWENRYSLMNIRKYDEEFTSSYSDNKYLTYINIHTNHDDRYEIYSNDTYHYYRKDNANNIIYDLKSDDEYLTLFPNNKLDDVYSVSYNFAPSDNEGWWYSLLPEDRRLYNIQSALTNNEKMGALIIADVRNSQKIVFKATSDYIFSRNNCIKVSEVGNRAYVYYYYGYYIFNLDDLIIEYKDNLEHFECMNTDCSVFLASGRMNHPKEGRILGFKKVNLKTGKETFYDEDILSTEYFLSPDGNFILTRFIDEIPFSFIDWYKGLRGKLHRHSNDNFNNFRIYHDSTRYSVNFPHSFIMSVESIDNNGNVIFSIIMNLKYQGNDKYEEYRLIFKDGKYKFDKIIKGVRIVKLK
jgi:hypothetical protein